MCKIFSFHMGMKIVLPNLLSAFLLSSLLLLSLQPVFWQLAVPASYEFLNMVILHTINFFT